MTCGFIDRARAMATLLLAARELARHKVDALGKTDLGQLLDGNLRPLPAALEHLCCASMTFF